MADDHDQSVAPTDGARLLYSFVPALMINAMGDASIEPPTTRDYQAVALFAVNIPRIIFPLDLHLLWPARVRAVVGLSVPYARWTIPEWCTQEHWGDEFFYWAHFCEEEGLAERLLEEDIRLSLKTMHIHTSGDRGKGVTPKQEGVRSLLEAVTAPPDKLPPWMTEEDLDYYVKMYEISGFRGGINWYRNIPTLHSDTPELDHAKITQPAIFVQGSRDIVEHMVSRESQIENFEDLRSVHVLDGIGHWVQVEATEELNKICLDFLAEFV